jgi:uncharacterized membrane protein
MQPWMVAFHVVFNLVWVGAVLGAVVVAGECSDDRMRASKEIFTRLALPGFLGSFALGLVRLIWDWRLYLVTTHFMHAKLLLALIAIVAHHVIGAKLKRGSVRFLSVWGVVFAVGAFGSAVVAIVKPF